MEQEFDVEIKEVLSRVQKVKAESLDDAINKAMDMYYAEQIVLGAEDMKGVDFAPISEGQLPSSLKENGGKARSFCFISCFALAIYAYTSAWVTLAVIEKRCV